LNKIKACGLCVYKKTKTSYEILMCKSVLSTHKWGFLKGVKELNETDIQTAIREFYEESNIKINKNNLENLIIQKNKYKDISIFMINYKNIKNINIYFKNNILYKQYLCHENSNIKFFDINNLPEVKKKQNKILDNILVILENKDSKFKYKV
jgi:8-oxo-dGTP pyrophosphatase MutT (NUDIX family)